MRARIKGLSHHQRYAFAWLLLAAVFVLLNDDAAAGIGCLVMVRLIWMEADAVRYRRATAKALRLLVEAEAERLRP